MAGPLIKDLSITKVDHGVQYISPKSKEFKKFIQFLYKKKELKIWDGNHLDFTFEKEKKKNILVVRVIMLSLNITLEI